MKRVLGFLACLMFFYLPTCIGQYSKTENLRFLEDEVGPSASIEDLAWLEGRWRGEAFGGMCEEIWSPAHAGVMLATFRVMSEKKNIFYEICLIEEVNNTLTYKVKHFSPNFSGWEEKDDYVEFKLVDITENAVYFDGLTMKLVDDDTIHVYLAMTSDGETKEEKLIYHRY